MAKHRTIYVAEDEVWNSIKLAAKSENRSISNYLVTLHWDNLKEMSYEAKDRKAVLEPE